MIFIYQLFEKLFVFYEFQIVKKFVMVWHQYYHLVWYGMR